MVINGFMAPNSTAMMLSPHNSMQNRCLRGRSSLLRPASSPASTAFPKVESHKKGALSVTAGCMPQFRRALVPLRREDDSSRLGYMSPLLPTQCKMRPRNSTAAASSKQVSRTWGSQSPRWWLRTLSCTPYLMPLYDTWICADAGYRLAPFLEKIIFLAEPLLYTMAVLPGWYSIAVFYIMFFGVVKRKDLPYFLRFHLLNSFLFSMATHIVLTVTRWMPDFLFCGWLAYIWNTVAIVQFFLILRCMQCALCGKNADVPFIVEAVSTNLRM